MFHRRCAARMDSTSQICTGHSALTFFEAFSQSAHAVFVSRATQQEEIKAYVRPPRLTRPIDSLSDRAGKTNGRTLEMWATDIMHKAGKKAHHDRRSRNL
jgi:hypothetical protein